MSIIDRATHWLRALTRRERLDRDLDKEMRLHLEMETASLIGRGMSPDDARRQAGAAFGGVDRNKEAVRDERGTQWLDQLRQDVILTWRGVRRAPGFTIVILATLALGIGANTAVFSVLRRVLLDRLPYRAPDQVMMLYAATAKSPDDQQFLSPAEIDAMARESRSLVSVAAVGSYGGYTYVSDRETDVWSGAMAEPGFFQTLGTPAMLGRVIDARDIGPGAAPVVVLSYGLWQRTFAGDSGVVGRAVILSTTSYTVIGVMPPTFVPPARSPEMWVPLDLARLLHGPRANTAYFQAVGRVREGTVLPQLRGELGLIVRRADEGTALAARERVANPVPVRESMVGNARPVLFVLMGAAAVVLLAACVNVAGLLLARATTRRRELAVRAALGAGYWRLVRQTLTESMLLAIAGGILGVLLAFWAKNVLVALGAPILPPLGASGVRLDTTVLMVALAVSAVAGVSVGVVPALISLKPQLNTTLAESGRGAAGGKGTARAGRVLVAAQAAFAVALLIAAGLLGRTLIALEQTGVGYTTEASVLSVSIFVSSQKYADVASRAQFTNEFLSRVRALPGVRSAAVGYITPWNGWYDDSVFAERQDASRGSGGAFASYESISGDYFATLGIPVKSGREFAAEDQVGTRPVAIISEALARKLSPARSPLGARIELASDTVWREVVGVVGDVSESPGNPREASVYVCVCQGPLRGGEFLVRGSGDAMRLVPGIRRELRALDPALPLVGARTMADVFGRSVAGQRLPLAFLGAFAALSLLLAALGVYGVMAYAVTARSREFGIRTALGGQGGRIVWLVMRQGLATVGIGTVSGLIAAAVGTRVLSGLLFGVTTHDPVTFIVAPLVLMGVGVGACVLPALRATRANPLDVLRAE
ncbi:MAG TPA: ABC transporter permease [Gemmatimonadaceae bacterium]